MKNIIPKAIKIADKNGKAIYKVVKEEVKERKPTYHYSKKQPFDLTEKV